MSHTENGAPKAQRSENTAQDRFLRHAHAPEDVLKFLPRRSLIDLADEPPNRAWHEVVQGHAWRSAEAPTLRGVRGVWERFCKEHPSKPLVIRVDERLQNGFSFSDYLEDICGEEGLRIVTPEVDVLYANGGYSVVVRGGLTSIGECAFRKCTGLTSVTFPEEGLSSIGKRAFQWCSGLTSVRLSENTQLGDSAFGSNVRVEFFEDDSDDDEDMGVGGNKRAFEDDKDDDEGAAASAKRRRMRLWEKKLQQMRLEGADKYGALRL